MPECVRVDSNYKQNVVKKTFIVKTWDRESGEKREMVVCADSMESATLLVPADFITGACRISLTEVND